MRSQMGFGFLMIFVAFSILALAVVFFYQTAIVPQLKSSTEELTTLTSGRIGTVKAAVSACTMWRSPQSFYDPAALSVSMVEAINTLFPDLKCSQNNPISCERACACLSKLSKYCHIGEPGSSMDSCKADPCRVQMEG